MLDVVFEAQPEARGRLAAKAEEVKRVLKEYAPLLEWEVRELAPALEKGDRSDFLLRFSVKVSGQRLGGIMCVPEYEIDAGKRAGVLGQLLGHKAVHALAKAITEYKPTT